MAVLSVEFKKKLGDMVALGHSRWAPVQPRKPYREDDEGGTGSASLDVKTHPYLIDVPEGAPSDMTADTSINNQITDEAEERVDQLDPELKLQQVLTQKMQYTKSAAPILTRH